MSKVDRRIPKSQEAIKKAIIELMSEKSFDDITIQDISNRADVSRGTIYLHYTDKFDLLDKLIASHINELHKMCKSVTELNYRSLLLIWCKYFENNYLFFSTMLASKGAPYFRNRFIDLVTYKLEDEVNVTEGVNSGLRKDAVKQFLGQAIVGLIEWWFINGMPFSPDILAEHLGALIERNL
ncbi:transcriptional regulator, TetR family [Clostridium sp. DL-VIII]|uniref:TetR/AcrR family transcriptional regulator n=1 Tax=Clostridium sp. DL-VIII TaxID=641107 RepID=UPI00023AFE49|nr:TetR/AcrR family transcriptional regulator [Clostridium sp. DL-VIII]EHI98420.1 transcriptional regulator, TetR family [Clostridium sp. DL-VIII]